MEQPNQSNDRYENRANSIVNKFTSVFGGKKKTNPSKLSHSASLSSMRKEGSTRSMDLSFFAEKMTPEDIEHRFLQIMEDSGMPVHLLTPEFAASKTMEFKMEVIRNNLRLNEVKAQKLTPEYFMKLMEESDNPSPGDLKSSHLNRSKLLKKDTAASLRIQLTNQQIPWIRDFILMGGSDLLVKCLKDVYFGIHLDDRRLLMKEWLRAVRAFTNNNAGLGECEKNQDLLNSLALYMASDEVENTIIPLNIFTVICYSKPPESAIKILQSMSYLQNVLEEENRFDSFLKMLSTECKILRSLTVERASQKSDNAVIDGLIFINALLDNLDDYEMRIHVRNQIYRRPFRSEFEKLKDLQNTSIQRQLDVFTALFQADAEWVMEKYNKPPPSFVNPSELFDILGQSLKGTNGLISLVNLLQHLLALQADPKSKAQYIKLLDKTLESLIFKGRGLDPDFCSSPIPTLSVKDLEKLLNTKELDSLKEENMRLKFEMTYLGEEKRRMNSVIGHNQDEHENMVKSLNEKIESLEKSMTERESKFLAEKEKLKSELEEAKNQLMKEVNQSKAQVKELEEKIMHLKRIPSSPTSPTTQSINFSLAEEEKNTSHLIVEKRPSTAECSTENIKQTDPVKKAIPTSIPIPPPPPPVSKSAPPPPPPPIPGKLVKGPPGSPPIPPPPPPSMPGSRKPSVPEVPSIYPTSSCRLKNVSWKKLTKEKLLETIWDGYDPLLFKDKVDYQKIDQLFEGTQLRRPSDTSETVKSGGQDIRAKCIEVMKKLLNQSTQQNLAIMIKQKSLDQMIEGFDKLDDSLFGVEVANFLAKRCDFVGEEACEKLRMLGGNSDGFMDSCEVLVVKVNKYRKAKDRLQFLGLKSQINEAIRICEHLLTPYFSLFSFLSSCDRLKKIFWLALFLGNYLNQGTSRGESAGFELQSLELLRQVRASEGGVDLFSHLTEIVAKEFPDYLHVIRDLVIVKESKSMKFSELEEAFAEVNDVVRKIEKLIEDYRVMTCEEDPDRKKEGKQAKISSVGLRGIMDRNKTDEPTVDSKMEIGKKYIEDDDFVITARQAKESLAKLDLQRVSLLNEKGRALRYFVADTNMTTEAFVSIFADFLADFESSKIQNEKRELEKERESRMQNARHKMDGRKSIVGIINAKSDQKGIVDNVLATLRQGRTSLVPSDN